MRTLVRVALALLVAVVLSGTASVPTSAAERAAVNRASDTVLPGERYVYQRENWRVREAERLPRWLHQRRGRLTGTAPRLGRWRIVLEERGTGKQRGRSRRTVLVLRSVTERAAPGTVLVTRGLGGRPANAGSTRVVMSGDGSTVVFSSLATNLVPGTKESVGRIYVWDAATQQVSLLHPEAWARTLGVSRDGRRVLVGLSAGIFLLDRADGSQTQVATRPSAHAALTADGERVLYQESPGGVPARLVEWTRATATTRTIVADLGGSDLVGVSSDGRLALLTGDNQSELLDTTTGEVRSVGRLGVEGGYPEPSSVSDDGRLLAVHGSGPAAGHGHGGDRVDVVQDVALGGPRGPRHNPGAAITPDGTHYAVATATRHLRVVDVATGARTSPFLAPPGGEELGASLSDDASRLAYVSDASDLLHGTRRGVANVFVWGAPTVVTPRLAVGRTEGSVLPGGRYEYRPRFWRVDGATGVPRWLKLHDGRLTGTSPRLGRWRIVLAEHGVLRHRGERRRTVLTLRSVRPRAVAGTRLVSRGHDGRPANGPSFDPVLSGDGSTVVFASTATNLVRGTTGRAKRRLYAWDARARSVSLVSDRQEVTAVGLSRDGRQLLTSDEDTTLHLLDLRTRTRVEVAARSEEAALTADGSSVLYQDVPGVVDGEPAHLMRWDASTGRARQVMTLPPGLRFTGAISTDAGLALLGQTWRADPGQQALLLDLADGSSRDVPGLQLSSWYFDSSIVSTDGRRLALSGSDCVVPDPPPDCGYAAGFVYDVESAQLVDDGGALRNHTVDMTPDGRFYTAGAPHGHLRLVDTATGEAWSAFRSEPTGVETSASVSDDGTRVAYDSTGVDLLPGTRRGVANVYLWARPR